MNVFVLCTGRCGSVTFARACEAITNFSSGHETRCERIGSERLNFPPNHIEVDNRLSWFLGDLDRIYGDQAFYVHLIRDEKRTAESFARRMQAGQILHAFRNGIVMGSSGDYSNLAVSRYLVSTVNSNIRLFLKDKTRSMVVHMETMQDEFPEFWRRVGAEGDLKEAIGNLAVRHNESLPQQRFVPTMIRRAKNALAALRD